MADEISVTVKATVINGELRDQFIPGPKSFDQGTAERFGRTMSLTTNSTTLDIGGLASNKGWCFCTNLSTASEIVIGPTSGTPFIRVFPSSSQAFGLVAATTLVGKTLSGTADLDYRIWST